MVLDCILFVWGYCYLNSLFATWKYQITNIDRECDNDLFALHLPRSRSYQADNDLEIIIFDLRSESQ